MTDGGEEPPPIEALLEQCFEAISQGREPDLDALSRGNAELRQRVESILGRERRHIDAGREALQAASREAPPETQRPGATTDPSVPNELGGFALERLIGRGGMGIVYQAHDHSLNRTVALKVLRPDTLDDPSATVRFQREASITAALDHPNIVPVYATGTDGGFTYIAMKLLRGYSLDQGPRPLEPAKVAALGAAIARALHSAHAVGIVHRDVKPGNVFVENDTPYLLDFGLARIQNAATAITAANATPGTLAYMPPELLRPRAVAYDPRVDVYGLGATLYEMLAGENPFVDETPIRTIRSVLFKDAPALRLSGRDRDLETIVLRCLDKAPQKRFATAEDLAADLDRYSSGVPIRSRPTGPATRLLRRAQRHPWTAAASSGLAAAILTLGFVFWRSEARVEARIQRHEQAIGSSLAARDPEALATALANLAEDAPQHENRQRWSDDHQALADLRKLLVLLQAPEVEADPRLADEFATRLRASPSDLAETPLAQACLALFDIAVDPESDPSISSRVAAEYPGFSAVVSALGRGEAFAAAEGAPHGGPMDMVLSRAGLRLRGMREPTGGWDARIPEVAMERDAVQFAQAMEMALRQRTDRALEALDDLVASPSHGPLALTYRARILAQSGRLVQAQAECSRAQGTAAQHMEVPMELASLRIMHAQPDRGRFWTAWKGARSKLAAQPLYWQQGIEAAVEEGDFALGLSLVEDASQHCRPGPARVHHRMTALELRWNMVPGAEYIGVDMTPELRSELETLEQDALALADEVADLGVRDSRPLVIAARCARTLHADGDCWERLDRACREQRDELALSDFALAFSMRMLLHSLDPIGSMSRNPRAAQPRARRGSRSNVPAMCWTPGRSSTPAILSTAHGRDWACASVPGLAEMSRRRWRTSWDLLRRFENLDDYPEDEWGPDTEQLVERAQASGGICEMALEDWPEATRDERRAVLTRRAVAAMKLGLQEGWFVRSLVPTVRAAWKGMAIPAALIAELDSIGG